MDRDDVIATLNDLIETCKDGDAGFQACADEVNNPQLTSFFEHAARRCAEGAAQLQAKIRELGGDPGRSFSMLGAAHRGWMDVRSAISGMDDRAILTECERGEDYAEKAYVSALKENLPADVRSLVAKQFRVVKQNHDQVREMRDAMA
jgi:uncharacterized protein (TIGR02284 family)